jgi:hypothetical protein
MSIVENGRKSKPQDSNIPEEEEFDIVSRDNPQKPNFRATIQGIIILVLIATGAFGIGKYSELKAKDVPVSIVQANQASATTLETPAIPVTSQARVGEVKGAAAQLPHSDEVVASKLGKKYHYPWCSGAKRISPANKITFKSSEEARKAGYTPASNCKGLQ